MPRRLVLCLDEIEEIVPDDGSSRAEIKAYREIVGFLRGFAARVNGLRLIVCGMSPDVNRVDNWKKRHNNPVAHKFHEIFLGPFETQSEMKDMVRSIGIHMGIEYSDDSLDCLYAESGGHPYMTRLICSLAVARLPNERPIQLHREQILGAVDEFIRNPRTASYVERQLWGAVRDRFERQVLLSLAKKPKQTEDELIPDYLLPERRNDLERAIYSLIEKWLIFREPDGYRIPYGCLQRWIMTNCL
jgi:hypothetical protein